MKRKTLILLIFILSIATLFRLWQLDSIPPGLYPDEAINGNEAIFSPGKVFYPENNGREGLFINLIALSFSIFGKSIWSIRIVSAIIGIFTVLGLYLLTKELFHQYENSSRTIALLASFFLAISFWHTNFSRIGFRAILVPFILVFSFYFFLKGSGVLQGFKKQIGRPVYSTIFFFILAGIFFGLGFYAYTPFRLAILILPCVLIPQYLIYKKLGAKKQFFFFLFSFFFFLLAVALPLGIYFLQNPQYFISRAAPISVFATENPLKEFAGSLILHLAMFNFSGDSNWRHNFSGSPQLFWLVGILFLIGLIYSFLKTKEMPFNFLISWWSIMLLPGILTYEGIPHALRTIGVIPVVYIFASLGGWHLYQWLEKIMTNKKLLVAFCFLFFITLTYGQFCKYFWIWGQRKEVEDAFSKDYVKIGNYLNSLSPEVQKYVIVNQSGVPVPYPDGLPMPAQTPMFIETTRFGKPRAIYLLPEEINKITIKKEGVIVPLRYDERLFSEFRARFPEGRIQQEEGVWIYEMK